MAGIGQNWEHVAAAARKAALQAGRDPDSVRVLAVSKRQPPDAIAAAFEAGARDFGENYVQELAAKRSQVSKLLGPGADEIRWHFIGPLQRNKVRALGEVHLVHTVDSARLFAELGRRGPGVRGILIQVNIGMESTKAGVPSAGLLPLVDGALQGSPLLRGLMCIPPLRTTQEESRADFRALRGMLEDVHAAFPVGAGQLNELSMGMSGDFEAAIEEGATIVRVGTAIFGARR